ncbi:MAG: 2,3-bisphosphoglycerate-independent phosphoglycerate mutase [Deltaproteobacteria bacterium]|nr:2,3-bisphosphoglycerate-independent phosphoglycerate mutase [Deltaproteobacteria bacterium]
MTDRKPYMLMILDGWGINPSREGNAVSLARTPYLDNLMNAYPHTRLLCSGEAVGLPEGIMGNSEVGHLNIGAGRVVYQDLLRIDSAIRDGSFFENKVLNALISKVKSNNSALHLMGLVSDGGVHSRMNHLFALIDMAEKKGISRLYIHGILDGRDTPPDSGAGYINSLQEHLTANNYGIIATLCGRFYAMDRDTRWDRTEKAYRLFTKAEGVKEKDPVEAIKKAYLRDETDEFIQPIVMMDENEKSIATIKDGDGILFFNFRSDRARQITRAFTDASFESFNRNPRPNLCDFVSMTLYDEKFDLPMAFPPVHLDGILGEVISKQGLTQLRIAETEKYAHVTYFLNGGEEKPFPLEERCLIPSPREVPTYDLKPEMSAFKVAEELVSRIKSNRYDMIVVNFANMDMVGHTGILEAAIKACEAVDQCVEKVVTQVKAQGGAVVIISDHGNAEKMIEGNGTPHTAHTVNPVPLILVDDRFKDAALIPGVLGDVAPTLLHVMGIDKSQQMTGRSLIS